MSTTVTRDGRTWTYYPTAAAAPGRRAGWYDQDGIRATATLELYLAELARAAARTGVSS